MVLGYYDQHVPAAQLFRNLGTGRDGTRQGAIVRELRRSGLRASVRYDVDFCRICSEIDRGKLIIAYLTDAEHWVMLYGYRRFPDSVFVADSRPGEICEHDWEAYGSRLNRFGIVCSKATSAVAPVFSAQTRCGEQLSFQF